MCTSFAARPLRSVISWGSLLSFSVTVSDFSLEYANTTIDGLSCATKAPLAPLVITTFASAVGLPMSIVTDGWVPLGVHGASQYVLEKPSNAAVAGWPGNCVLDGCTAVGCTGPSVAPLTRFVAQDFTPRASLTTAVRSGG